MIRQVQNSLLGAVSAAFCAGANAATATPNDDAARVASELIGAASVTKESKQQFFQRITPTYRRVAATELMAQLLVGDAWRTMSPEQQAELTQLYEKIVMATLQGAYDSVAPTQFKLAAGGLYRSKSGAMKRRCDLLQKADCVFYAAKAKANDVVMEYRLMETDTGWQVVDLAINEMSVHLAYEAQVQEHLKFGTAHTLDKLRALVSRY